MNWAQSMIFLAGTERRIAKFIPMYGSMGDMEQARNHIVDEFLKTDIEWLFWIDTDVGFQRDILARLHGAGKDIVCAMYLCTKDCEPDGLGGFAMEVGPSVYRWHDDRVFSASDLMEKPKGLHQVDAMAGGCALVNRKVYEKLGPEPYNKINLGGNAWLSEDIAFCSRANDAGFEIWCDTSIPTNHLKPLWIGAGAAYDEAKPT